MMHISKDMVIKPIENEISAKRTLERFYIKNFFKNYIDNSMKPDTYYTFFVPEYKYYIMDLVIDYIDGLFTLPQLLFLYRSNSIEDPMWDYEDIKDRQINVIKDIDTYACEEDDLDDIDLFKERVMKLDPIVFNLLNDLIYQSGIFIDWTFWEGTVYPKMIEDENECSQEIDAIKNACSTLGKIEKICDKHYHINERIAALNKEGIKIRPCWVGSGGVYTEFYMYGKKEIRVQIAASKFKGKGTGKNKSALCAVIPMPKILSLNRN